MFCWTDVELALVTGGDCSVRVLRDLCCLAAREKEKWNGCKWTKMKGKQESGRDEEGVGGRMDGWMDG